MSANLPVLVSIPASNYVEKARWALQLAHIPFVEDKHVPIFHRFTTTPLGGTSVPLLSLPESKTVLRDSSAILDFCAKSEPSLYPSENTKERELYYDTELGPAARVVAYFFVFKSSTLARKTLMSAVSSRFERVLGTMLQPILRVFLFRFMSINEANVVRSIEKIEAIVRDANEQLGDGPVGTRFLAGDGFSAADISFCAHFGLLLAPPENVFISPYWALIANHPLQPRIEALQRSKAADFVRWCYQNKRPPMVGSESRR